MPMSQGQGLKKTREVSKSALPQEDREARYKARTQRTLDELVPISKKLTLLVHASANRSALSGLKLGMQVKETKRRMGERTRTGSSGYFTNIVLENPHQSMTFYLSKEEKIEILFYLTEVRKLDAAFTPEQFTPVHFINDRLTGWGWESLLNVKEGQKFGEECRSRLLKGLPGMKKLLET